MKPAWLVVSMAAHSVLLFLIWVYPRLLPPLHWNRAVHAPYPPMDLPIRVHKIPPEVPRWGESRKPRIWKTAKMDLRKAGGYPLHEEPWSQEYDVFVREQEVTKAFGADPDLVSDKPFNGRTIYDTLNPTIGGGGRYGTPASGMDSVHRGLLWLAKHQGPDGSWNPIRCPGSSCTGGKETSDDTALAVLAFLGAGYLPQSLDSWDTILYGEVVRRGVKWLAERETDDAPFRIAALCEADRRTDSPLIRDAARKAVRLIKGDPFALRAARRAGYAVPEIEETRWEVDSRMVRFLESTQDTDRRSCAFGSWDSVRITASNLLTLEIGRDYPSAVPK